jgi:Mg2+/citrate symporter
MAQASETEQVEHNDVEQKQSPERQKLKFNPHNFILTISNFYALRAIIVSRYVHFLDCISWRMRAVNFPSIPTEL